MHTLPSTVPSSEKVVCELARLRGVFTRDDSDDTDDDAVDANKIGLKDVKRNRDDEHDWDDCMIDMIDDR